nr:unnamed protein product [Leishmania braziliensis]
MHHDSMAQSPVPRPLPIPPPSPMLPPPEIKPPYELEMTSTGGGVKMVECTSVGPATNEARPAPEALPLPPVSGPSAIHYGRRRGSRPLCRCMKQRTDCGMRLSCARLGHRCLGVFPASLVRYRERQRRELGIERFRREGLCAEQSDAATLPLGDVLPPTDADTASDEQSDAATLPPVSGPSAIHYGRRRGSRPLCRCMKQRTNGGTQNEHELARLWPTNEKVPLPPVDNLCMTYLRPSTSLTNAMGSAVPTSSAAYTTQSSHQFILPPVAPVVDRPPLPFVRAPTWWANMREHFHLLRVVLFFFSLFFEPFPC